MLYKYTNPVLVHCRLYDKICLQADVSLFQSGDHMNTDTSFTCCNQSSCSHRFLTECVSDGGKIHNPPKKSHLMDHFHLWSVDILLFVTFFYCNSTEKHKEGISHGKKSPLDLINSDCLRLILAVATHVSTCHVNNCESLRAVFRKILKSLKGFSLISFLSC